MEQHQRLGEPNHIKTNAMKRKFIKKIYEIYMKSTREDASYYAHLDNVFHRRSKTPSIFALYEI